MADRLKISSLSLLLTGLLLAFTGCSSGVSRQQYDALQKQLSDANARIAALETQLVTLNETQGRGYLAQITALQQQVVAQTAATQTLQAGFDNLTAQYSDLTQQYEDLKTRYDAVAGGNVILSEDKINQAIFDLVNAERKIAGVPALVWGPSLYDLALQKDKEMAATGKYVYTTLGGTYHDIFWAINYGTVAQVAEAALINWRVDDYGYKNIIINEINTYGAVATYKSGQIYFISFMSSIFK